MFYLIKKRITLILLIIAIAERLIAIDYSFTSIEKLIEQEVGRIILPQIYSRLDLDITICPLPGKRAQYDVVSGKFDGEIMRVWTYGAENSEVLRVPTPYYSLETSAFVSKDSGIFIENAGQLNNYRIVKVRGVKHTNNITEGLANVIDVSSTEQMMMMLQLGRADVGLTNTIDGLHTIRQNGMDDIIIGSPPLARWDLYHYIRKDKLAHINEINDVIKKLKESGELSLMISDAERRILGE